MNPAACASRGVFPHALINHSLSWNGPAWLFQDSPLWASQDIMRNSQDYIPELRKTLSAIVVEKPCIDFNILEQFSSFSHAHNGLMFKI